VSGLYSQLPGRAAQSAALDASRYRSEVAMAIVLRGKTECSVCGNVIMNGDDIVATSHFIADKNDPSWRFSDSAMHHSCFNEWDHRAEFVAKFNRIVGETTFGNGTYRHMESDGAIIVLKRRY
jgi:hypothetical protein